MNTLFRIVAQFDDDEPFVAWWNGDRWNGWCDCYVTPDVRDRIAQQWAQDFGDDYRADQTEQLLEFLALDTDARGLISLNGYCVDYVEFREIARNPDYMVGIAPTEEDRAEAAEQGRYDGGTHAGYVLLGNGGKQCLQTFDSHNAAMRWFIDSIDVSDHLQGQGNYQINIGSGRNDDQ